MCGLVGALAADDSTPEELEKPIRLAMALMSRRGPDDEGFWSDRRRCAFGFRRLAVLDVAPSGHQPMATGDGRYVLVFNGEIYNFRELRAELTALGASFASSGDAAVVLQAIQI